MRKQARCGGRKCGRFGLVAALVSSAAVLAACGGNGPTHPNPNTGPTPQPVTQTVVAEGSVSGLRPFDDHDVSVTISQPGQIDVVVDWTFARNDVDAHLARGGCDFLRLLTAQCDVAASSWSTTAKPERLSARAAAAGVYTLMIPNFGPGTESIAYQVVLTTGGTASTTAASRDETNPVPPEKLRALQNWEHQ